MGKLLSRVHNRFLAESGAWKSRAGVVPVALPCGHGSLVAGEAVLEVVEDGELVAVQNVRLGLGGDLGPDLADGALQDAADSRIRGTVRALSGNLEGLRNAGGVLDRGCRHRRGVPDMEAVAHTAGEGAEEGQVGDRAARGRQRSVWEVVRLAVVISLRCDRQHRSVAVEDER